MNGEKETEAIIELDSDEQPKSGEWIDTDDVIENPTEEELEEGRRLGEELEDDYDEELDENE
jgi:hypothetical protein